jgi:MFS transporter, DHA2 family, multidrug resistance protein
MNDEARKRWVFVGIMLSIFLAAIESTVVATAMPTVVTSLGGIRIYSWVFSGFLLTQTVTMPLWGRFSDLYGRRPIYLVGLATFLAGSALSGASQNMVQLILFRMVQGLGAGALMTLGYTIIGELYGLERRARMQGYISSVWGLASLMGPWAGGVLTDHVSWRWVFYINLPIGILAALMVWSFIEDPPYLERSRLRRMDYLGFGFMSVWLGALQIMLDRGQEADWFSSSSIRMLAVVSGIAMLAFVIRELTTDEPIVRFAVLSDRNFAVGTIMITMLGFVIYGTTAMLPLFLQTLLGYSALDSGLAVSPRGIGAMMSAVVVGRLIGVVDSRLLIATGFATLAVSGWMFSHMTLDIARSNIVVASVMNGAATGLIFVPLSTTVMAYLPRERLQQATGIYNLMRNIGAGIGISLMTTFLARSTQAHQATLITHLTPYDPRYQQWLQAARSALASRGNPFTAPTQALAMLYAVVLRQATLLAFLDNFRLISLAGVVCVPLVLLFRRSRIRAAR